MKHYKEDGLFDFYAFDTEIEAKQFSVKNLEYNNIYYSWGWRAWIASKNIKK